MTATKADIAIFRNEIRTFSGQYLTVDGLPLSLAGVTLTSSAKAQAGDVTVVANADFVVIDEALGLFSYSWDGADFSSYGSLLSECQLAYDLKVNSDVILYGQLILKPGVTA